MGRWQLLGKNPPILADSGHNIHSLQNTILQIQKQSYNKLHIVLGFVNDKNLDKVLPLFPSHAIYYFCRPNIPRGLDANVLQEQALNYSLTGEIYPSVKEALQSASQNADNQDFIFIGGSTFVVAEVL